MTEQMLMRARANRLGLLVRRYGRSLQDYKTVPVWRMSDCEFTHFLQRIAVQHFKKNKLKVRTSKTR